MLFSKQISNNQAEQIFRDAPKALRVLRNYN